MSEDDIMKAFFEMGLQGGGLPGGGGEFRGQGESRGEGDPGGPGPGLHAHDARHDEDTAL
jgi:hypothetical protein